MTITPIPSAELDTRHADITEQLPTLLFPRLDPAVMHQIIVVLSAHNSNPNGDPDMNNEPRQNPFNEHGIISAVSVKRKIRDYVSDKMGGASGFAIMIRHGEVIAQTVYAALTDAGVSVVERVAFNDDERAELLALNEALPGAFVVNEHGVSYDNSLNGKALAKIWKDLEATEINVDIIGRLKSLTAPKDKKAKKADREEIAGHGPGVITTTFFDARVFGFTAAESAGKLCGPVQVTDFESVRPINTLELTSVRVARGETSDKDGSSNFGRKTVVDHAVYVGCVHVNPSQAAKTGVSAEDLGLVLEGLYYGQSLARSAIRSDVRVEALVVLTHASRYGSAPYHHLERRLNVTHDGKYGVGVEFDTAELTGVSVCIVR